MYKHYKSLHNKNKILYLTRILQGYSITNIILLNSRKINNSMNARTSIYLCETPVEPLLEFLDNDDAA